MGVNKASYYALMRELARHKREEHAVKTESFGVREVRAIYKREKIIIDIRKLPACLRAIYLAQDGEVSVAVRQDLPNEPKIFALMHELKHHWVDQELIRLGLIRCGDYNANELQEKGAEVFAAEFIYPENEFLEDVSACDGAEWKKPEDLVRFKRLHSRAKVSYKFIQKGLERRGFIQPDQFSGVKFHKLEEQMFGVPFYKQQWFKDRRGS